MGDSKAPFDAVASALKTWPGPAWLTESRATAIDRFRLAGLPSTRLEAWRTTPLPDLGPRAFSPGSDSTGAGASAAVQPLLSADATTLVFVNGFYSEALSSPEASFPRGVRLTAMSRLLSTSPDELRPWFAANVSRAGSMHDLNAAAFRDGASIVVDDNVRVAGEVRVIVISTAADEPIAQHVRHHVRIGRGASLRLMIAVVGDSGTRGFTNQHTALRLADRARLDLVRVHESPIGTPHFDALSATLDAEAVLNDTLLQTGPSWTRSEIDVALKGERATADLGGVFVARGTQVSDIHTVLVHEAPGVTSRQNYRGLAADEARGVFHGQIQVEATARGTDATQSNKNMLLSKRAQVHSTPALEILTDDVKCKHGSATGQIDPAQLFYLRSRGLDLSEATRILTRSFAAEIVSRIAAGSTRDAVETQIAPSLEALGTAA